MAKDTIEQYQDNPPMPSNAEEELFLWKRRWEFLSKSSRPSTISLFRKACDHDIYANLHMLLTICGTNGRVVY